MTQVICGAIINKKHKGAIDLKITLNEYEKYKSAIEAANDKNDKESLRQIQKQLIARFGLDNDDVKALLKKFKFSV